MINLKSPDYQFENIYSAPWQKANIDNLDTVSQDEVVFTILSHLRKQGERAAGEHGGCYYKFFKEEDGTILSCAAGVLLPNDREDLGDFDTGWPSLLEVYPDISKNHCGTISYLQRLHDDSGNWRRGNLFIPEYFIQILKSDPRITAETFSVFKYFISSNP